MRKSNYDKQPSTHIEGSMTLGWDNIISTLCQAWADEPIWAIDLYPGTYEEDFMAAFEKTGRKIIDTRSLMRPEEEIRQLTERFMTDDVLFGYMSNIRLEEYFPSPKPEIKEHSIVIGTAAARLAPNAPVCYADMARWEIQQRFRRHEVKALGIDNHHDSPSVQYKRGYFNDWNIIDHYKDNLMQSSRIQYWIDSNQRNQPKMITDAQMRQGLQRTAHSPFRVVPFFDPAPWPLCGKPEGPIPALPRFSQSTAH